MALQLFYPGSSAAPIATPAPAPTPAAAANAMGHDSNLIATIRDDLAANSIVGEEDNALLIYLVYTSRLLDNPGAVVTRGASSSGKSQLLYRVADFFPQHTKVETMRMTEASLFRTPEDYFEHKIVICGERKHAKGAAAADATAVMRQLLSEKKITRSIVDRGETILVERHGPIAFAESTTAESIFEEDLNRMLQLFLDSSEQQTRRVLQQIASKCTRKRPRVSITKAIARHHRFQELLEPQRIHIPYAERLANEMPVHKVEARRVFQMVLTIVEAITLLHQHQRQKKSGCLVATVADYALARQLLLAPVQAALGVGRDYKKAESLRVRLGDKARFSAADVADAMGYETKMGASHLLGELTSAKLVECVTRARGRTPASYKWAAINWDILPAAEQLSNKEKHG